MRVSVLVLLGLSCLLAASGSSYDSNMMPETIKSLKLSPYLVGLIRSLFGLSNLLFAIFPNRHLIEKLGRLNMIIVGGVIIGGSIIALNVSFFITNGTLFLTSAILFTILQGMGNSIANIGGNALVAAFFP